MTHPARTPRGKMHRMLRAVLVGLLSVSAVACKFGGESPKSQPGVAVGKVVEVAGTVTVRHADVARPLAKGDAVEGDDVIETGADGNVIIELAHNLARWELGPNKKSMVRESAAFRLAKKTGDVTVVHEDTAAAGRPAERSAADTSVSASAEMTRAPARAAAPEPASAPPPHSETAQAASPPPPPREQERARATAADQDDLLARPSGGGGVAVEKKNKTGGVGDLGTVGRGGGTAKGVGLGAAGVGASGGSGPGAPSPDAAARDVVVKHEAAIKTCLTKDAQAVSLRIVVAASGKATVLVTGKTEVPERVKQCVTNAVAKLTFAKAAATVNLDIAR
jgi:hypothetical protein